MKVILNADLSNLGRKGDVVEVKPGYARNFLLPKNLAISATKGSIRQAEQMAKATQERVAKEIEAAQQVATRISAVPIRIPAKAGEDGQLFGSITTADLAERLAEIAGIEIDRRKIQMEPVRSVGSHDFRVELHPEVELAGTLEVVVE